MMTGTGKRIGYSLLSSIVNTTFTLAVPKDRRTRTLPTKVVDPDLFQRCTTAAMGLRPRITTGLAFADRVLAGRPYALIAACQGYMATSFQT